MRECIELFIILEEYTCRLSILLYVTNKHNRLQIARSSRFDSRVGSIKFSIGFGVQLGKLAMFLPRASESTSSCRSCAWLSTIGLWERMNTWIESAPVFVQYYNEDIVLCLHIVSSQNEKVMKTITPRCIDVSWRAFYFFKNIMVNPARWFVHNFHRYIHLSIDII